VFLVECPISSASYYFTGCLPWPQKGTASFIADTGNLAVESVPQYPFGHSVNFVGDSSNRIQLRLNSNQRNIKISRITRVILLAIETLPIVPD
jgi:hypothetical protein